jgi:hypothetical protein
VAKGQKHGGRKKGTPNKATADVRAAIALIAQRNVRKVEKWLEEVEDPAKRVDLFLSMCEYHIPKLARTELTGKDGKDLPLVVQAANHDESL